MAESEIKVRCLKNDKIEVSRLPMASIGSGEHFVENVYVSEVGRGRSWIGDGEGSEVSPEIKKDES